MPHAFLIIDHWVRRIVGSLSVIFFPGLAALFLIDLNANIFRGEFGLSDLTNFNTVVVYYVEKLDIAGQQTLLYAAVMGLLVYLTGYFLYSSSKFFAGPQRFRRLFQVGDCDETPHLELPPSALAYLQAKPGDLLPGSGEETCQALVDAACLPSRLPSLERRTALYRSMGYLFSLMVLMDLGLFLVSFDFGDIIIKCSLVICNLTLAFLFFKGQQESAQTWKEQLSGETLVAIARLQRQS